MNAPNRRGVRCAVCSQCTQVLPLRKPESTDLVEVWQCNRCRSLYTAVRLEEPPREIDGNATLVNSESSGTPKPLDRFTLVRRDAPVQRMAMPIAPDRESSECTYETAVSRQLDAEGEDPRNLQSHHEGPPVREKLKPKQAVPYDEESVKELQDHVAASQQQLEHMIESLENAKGLDPELPEQISRESITKATNDLDLFVRLGISPPTDGGYPSNHSLHVAMLAAAVGTTLGWDEETVTELGMGCLLHDIGMLEVPEKIHLSNKVLDDFEFNSIVKHPLQTFDLLSDELERIPQTSRMVAYQMHERCNGRGYPRKRSGNSLHEASRVAAVADVYIALVSPRPHRVPVSPHLAMQHVVRGVSERLFDSESVRALLETVGLYPIGSHVELSDGRVGRVLRANGKEYDRPILEVWNRDNLDSAPMIVNLLEISDVGIARAVADFHASAKVTK